jgi:hypothetical protein
MTDFLKCTHCVDKKIFACWSGADLKIKNATDCKFILNLNHVKKASKFNNPKGA